MSKIIIGIHGLGNKPQQQQLEQWWKSAIDEGLENYSRLRFLKFSLVYWASVLHERPYKVSILDKDDPLYLNEPYIRGSKDEQNRNWQDENKNIRKLFNEQMDKIFLEEDGSLNFSRLTDFILHHFIKDLDAYYRNDENRTREKICSMLAGCLKKHRRKKIMLVAHSMGTIIAWDVLTRWVPEVKIHSLVTIGSPLGNPVVRGRMLSDIKDASGETPLLKTPENIQKNWQNLADYKDRVAINYKLKDDFLPNSRGVQPQDQLIWNNYEFGGERNPHKSYGYLRCPEMANIISGFYKPGFSLKSVLKTNKSPILNHR